MRSSEWKRRYGAPTAVVLALTLALGVSPGVAAAGRTVIGEMFGGSG